MKIKGKHKAERTDKTKQAGLATPTTEILFVRTGANGQSANKTKNKKARSKKTTFKAAAAVCGAGSRGRCPLVGLVPCYPLCHLLPALANRVFPATVTPPLLFTWGPPVVDA